MSLALLELVKNIFFFPEWNVALRIIYTLKHKHNNINKHSDKHANQRKHTSNNHYNRVLNKLVTKVLQKDLVKKGLWLANRAWVG